MKQYAPHVEHYRWEGFHAFSSRIPREEWGNTEQAEVYLGKYWLDSNEFNKVWLPVMGQVFASEPEELPDMMFKPGFQLIPQLGGAVFIKEDFDLLQECMKETNDTHFVIIENAVKRTSPPEDPPFRMKYPSNITWAEVMSGNYISSMIFEASMKSYFIFGDSGLWGKYAATDYYLPVDIIGFKLEYAQVFTDKFKVPSGEDQQEIMQCLKPEYQLRLPPN
jgi:hypothetical protein